ncbi:hypothetical protein C8R42DRAFT_707559 [Lentinula raphanica]|nr:hypothetical protein C8R42DRAFT_707559 [Lentinula raphanica]
MRRMSRELLVQCAESINETQIKPGGQGESRERTLSGGLQWLTAMKIRWLLYTLLCVVADTLDTFLSSVISSRPPCASLQPSDVDLNLSDEGTLELELKAPKLYPDYSLLQLTPGTVAKYSEDRDEDISDASEANALNLVFAETNIPVPRDYIKGSTLADAWSKYSVSQKICVAFTLRRYARQLRRLKASPRTPPGPFSKDGPRICPIPARAFCFRTSSINVLIWHISPPLFTSSSAVQDSTGIDPCKQLELNPNPHERDTVSSLLPVRSINRKVGRIRKNLDILNEYYHDYDYEEKPEPKMLRATIYYKCLAQIKTQIENVVEEHRRAGTKWTDEEVFREIYKTHEDWVDV